MALNILIDQDKTDANDALFSVVNILNTKVPTGFNDSNNPGNTPFEGDPSTNLMDIIGFVKNDVPGGASIIDLAHTLSPAANPVEIVKGKLVGSPTIKAFIDALAPANSESELGGDALGAVVTHLQSIPVTKPVIDTFVQTFVANDGVLSPVTNLLHEVSLGGHILSGTTPAGSTFASESTDITNENGPNTRDGEDSLDQVVQFFQFATGTGGDVIPGIFPNALGDDVVAIAKIAHDVLPLYTTTNGLLGVEDGVGTGIISSVVPAGGLGGLGDLGGLGLTDLLDLGGANPLDGLLGGLDLLGGANPLDGLLGGLTGASAEASAEGSNGGLLAILDLGNGGLLGSLDLNLGGL